MALIRSLSSRRAWIEIINNAKSSRSFSGRSPHGERGLKSRSEVDACVSELSLSSRRAWIEMFHGDGLRVHAQVALLTESVD